MKMHRFVRVFIFSVVITSSSCGLFGHVENKYFGNDKDRLVLFYGAKIVNVDKLREFIKKNNLFFVTYCFDHSFNKIYAVARNTDDTQFYFFDINDTKINLENYRVITVSHDLDVWFEGQCDSGNVLFTASNKHEVIIIDPQGKIICHEKADIINQGKRSEKLLFITDFRDNKIFFF